VKVVPATEDLHVVAVRNKSFGDVVDLLRLLRLASSLGEDDILLDVESAVLSDVAFNTDEACFLGVLEVEAVTFGDFAVNGLLDPGDLVNQGVTKLLEEIDSETILGIDDPDKQVT